MSKRALVVEDDGNIAELIRMYLAKDGFDVMIASDGGKAEADFDLFQPDIVLLDIMLPVKNGWEICRDIRKKSAVPIIMLTAKGETADKVNGLEMGADDYLTKPFEVKELLARIHAVMRRTDADAPVEKKLVFDKLIINLDSYELIVDGKKVDTPPKEMEHLHTHNTAGTGDMLNLKAIEAGCDIVDTALSPLGNGTSQPATEPLVATLAGTKFDTGIKLEDLNDLTKYFTKVAERLTADGFLSPKVLKVDVNALIYQVPGGMLSNLISQLKQAGASDKLIDVLEEVPRVRADLGYPPLVTPSSQIVGTQAVLNVLSGERYKMVTKETKGMLRGEYGRLPVEPSADVIKKIIGDEPRITCRPADNIKSELEGIKKEIAEYYECEEDLLTYALFPQLAIPFFKRRQAAKLGIDKTVYDSETQVHPV